jgi:ABC-type nitrate/sulfonate/bicarbonate transport system substrate-binding protein/cyclopropane fatty-acyl-phospholipid synthase-like methyltransferase
MNRPHFRIGGVPEHFNFPWHLAVQHELFADYDFSIDWQDYPGGTGAMCRALRTGELDLAVVLTEGAVADIVAGSPARIVGTYVNSPLVWGVHLHASNQLTHPASLEHRRFAVSRYGSGSHLMALVHAQQSGWDPAAMQFEVVGGLEGARAALASGQAEAFMWEKYTTKPIVDAGEFRRLAAVRTPWPCFVMLARPDLFEAQPNRLETLMYLIRRARQLLPEADTLAYLSEHYQLQPIDVASWYAQTEWLVRPHISHQTLDTVQHLLQEAGVIEAAVPVETLTAPMCQVAEDPLSAVMYDWRVSSMFKMLALQGKSSGPLRVEDLTELGHLDQYHYLGEQTSQEVVALLDLKAHERLLDIGSGVGGTARVVAERSGCQVVGIELQPDLNRLADDLTRRTGLHDRVSYETTDFLAYRSEEPFDAFISLLVFLHLPQREAALRHSLSLLKPGGRFMIEDLVLLAPLTGEEQHSLSHTVSAPSVSTVEAYLQALRTAGFVDLVAEDMTPQWRPWTADRYLQFVREEAFNRPFFGEKIFNNRAYFYRSIRDLFASGHVGGVRIIGRKGE